MRFIPLFSSLTFFKQVIPQMGKVSSMQIYNPTEKASYGFRLALDNSRILPKNWNIGVSPNAVNLESIFLYE